LFNTKYVGNSHTQSARFVGHDSRVTTMGEDALAF
jgi:hypothetical protein